MEEFIQATLAAERRLQGDIKAGIGVAERQNRWEKSMWQARNYLPADPKVLEQVGMSLLEEIDQERLKKVKALPDAPDSDKSQERKDMEAAGYVGAKGPDMYSISVCRREGDLLRPIAHYWHGRSQWWNVLKPKGGKAAQGRGMKELLKAIKEAWG